MSELTVDPSQAAVEDHLVPQGGLADVSEADVNAFLEHLLSQAGEPTEAELKAQFDKNFQTMSYLFMKRIYSHAEDEIRRRQ